MSHLDHIKNTYMSGDVGTTGREPFETPIGSATPENQGRVAGEGPGTGAHHHSHNHTGDDCVHESHRTGGLGNLTSSHNHTGDDCIHESHRSGGVLGGISSHNHTGDDCVHESHRSKTDHYGYDSNRGTDSYGTRDGDVDRTGNLQQGVAGYERTGPGGPTTSGAAGTDRFDTDKHHHGVLASGTHGGPVDDTYAHNHGKNEGTEGVKSVLTTSDKEFTNRDRLGPAGGAYTDTDGRFETNQTGPSGPALTGREGNFETNPVSGKTGGVHVGEHTDEMGNDANARATGTREDGAEGTAHGHAADGKEAPQGILGKIKAALH